MHHPTRDASTDAGWGAVQTWADHTSGITHIMASKPSKQVAAHAAKYRDVIHLDWLAACLQTSTKQPLRPAHYLALSEATRLHTPGMSKHGDL